MTDDNLLTPVLDERHDLVGFSRPWNPWRLVFITFFAGAFGGAYLFAVNSKKLGQRKNVLPCAIVFAFVGILQLVLLAYYIDAAITEDAQNTIRRTFRLISRVVNVLLASGIAYFQVKRFRIFEFGDEEEGALLWHALGAIAGSYLVSYAVGMPSH